MISPSFYSCERWRSRQLPALQDLTCYHNSELVLNEPVGKTNVRMDGPSSARNPPSKPQWYKII